MAEELAKKCWTANFQSLAVYQVTVVEGGAFGLQLKLIDTPGLHPASGSQRRNEKILKKVNKARTKHKPDLVIYCERLDMVSITLKGAFEASERVYMTCL